MRKLVGKYPTGVNLTQEHKDMLEVLMRVDDRDNVSAMIRHLIKKAYRALPPEVRE